MTNSNSSSKHPITILFAGGGTGGHLFPGLSVAEVLQHQQPDWRILFAGSERDIEQKILQQSPYSHHALKLESTAQLRRHPIRVARSFWSSYRECVQLFNETKPACVIGLGGYASLPVLFTARQQRVPMILLEQNKVIGRANRLFARTAKRLCISFEETIGIPPAASPAVRLTGNPVRQKIVEIGGEQHVASTSNKRLTVLVLGGSQGSEFLNQLVLSALAKMPLPVQTQWQILHQAGPQMTDVIQAYQQTQLLFEVAPFFSEIADCYRSADIVIARAGATTLAELASAGKPAILIPYPDSVGNHQLKNAQHFESVKAACLIEQQHHYSSSTEELTLQLELLMNDVSLRQEMQKNMLKLAKPKAACEVSSIIQNIVTDNL